MIFENVSSRAPQHMTKLKKVHTATAGASVYPPMEDCPPVLPFENQSNDWSDHQRNDTTDKTNQNIERSFHPALCGTGPSRGGIKPKVARKFISLVTQLRCSKEC